MVNILSKRMTRVQRMRIHLLMIVFIAVISSGCSGTSSSDSTTETESRLYHYTAPMAANDGWQTAHVSETNINESDIELAIESIVSGQYINVSSIQIARNGLLVVDELIRTRLDANDNAVQNTDLNIHTMQSATKSFVATMVGIAVDQDLIESVDTPVYSLFPEYSDYANWNDAKNSITIENFLTMQHGFDYNEWDYPATSDQNTLHYLYRNYGDFVKGLLDLPMATEPGTEFVYSTMVSHALGAIVANASGMSIPQFAETYLFEPLDFGITYWLFSPSNRAMTGCCLFVSGRDMLKLGQLYLDGGIWNGKRIVSETWVEQSIQAYSPLELGFSEGYGYQWWTRNFTVGANTYSAFFAAGNGGQFIYVFPELDTVFAFTGENYGSLTMYQITDLLERYLLKSIR